MVDTPYRSMFYKLYFCIVTFDVLNMARGIITDVHILAPKLGVEDLCSNLMDIFGSNDSACGFHMQNYCEKFLNQTTWAMRMIDSSTKIPEGILMGSFTHMGNYDECLSVQNVSTVNGSFNGQHCLASFIIPSDEIAYSRKQSQLQSRLGDLPLATNYINLMMSYCIPSTCSAKELQDGLNKLLTLVLSPQLGSIDVTVQVADYNCHTNKSIQLETVDYIAIFVLAVLALFCICSTTYDLCKKGEKNELLLAFSWYTNGRKLLSTSSSSETLQALHGIRFLSICWVVFGHTYYIDMLSPSSNLTDFQDFVRSFWRLYVTNATLSVDSFFLLSGLLLSYVFLKQMNKTPGACFNIPLFYVHRYIRLTPALAVMIMLQASLLYYTASGPIWDQYTRPLVQACRKNWWTELLYVNNYVVPNESCVGQSWYLAVDMQLFILSPIILYPLWKCPKKINALILGAFIVAGIVTSFTISYVNDFSGSLFNGDPKRGPEVTAKFYVPTHTRFAPWVIGVAFGYLLYETRKQKSVISKKSAAIYWCVAIVTLLASLLGAHPFNQKDESISTVLMALYNGTFRAVWALGVGCLIFVCLNGYGGFVNTFLSWKVFQPLSRLTYCIYLVHLSYKYTKVYSERMPHYMGDIYEIPEFFSMLTISTILAAILSLSCEAPAITIEKVLLGKGGRDKSAPGESTRKPKENKQ